ncbi:sce7726 family protein [Azospirillum sp. ST 5-10]|uniref:sce7726 family protein n=1 Tax=unclassified Azospirillum TaxID=2630922 RepID=UPI003F4A3155
MTPDASQLSAISRLFSSAVFREMARKGRSPTFARLIGEARIEEFCPSGATVGEAFDAAFAVLRRIGQRDEYVYRAALTRNILLGKHSLNTASMLNEFRVGVCKADLVILNGTATVYEIKSERDSLARLERQVENYRKVFAKVYVIASETHVRGVMGTVPEEVGVMSLSPRFHISTIRDAADCSEQVCPQAIFDSLRSAEARAVLKELGTDIPDVPNTMMHAIMREVFGQLRPVEVHKAMVQTLKRTRNLAPLGALVDRLPTSLHAAALSIQVRRADHDRLVDSVRTPLASALDWG